jgi:amino acid adenylation domain-containing protein
MSADQPAMTGEDMIFPLSFAQRRLWFLSRLEGPGVTYNMAGALWLRGPLDCGALGAAVNDVIERHEPLRTVFPDVDGEPCQQILPMARARLELGVLEPGPGEFGVALERAANHVFDLAEAVPPFWAQLLAAGTDEHVLMIVAHHIAGDGWSTGRLLRDVGRAYQARSRGRVPDWEPLPVRYVDYTLWQTELLGQADDPGSVLAGQLAFWAKELAGAPACLPLPADRPRPPFASYRGDAVPLALSRGLHARLAGLARENEATLFMVLHAGLAVLLSRRGAGTDITVGSPLAGRTDEALDDLVGFFINTVVVRTDLSADPAFRSLLAQVRERVLAVLENQDVPFELVVEHLNPERSPSRNPLFQVMLTLQNMPRDADLVPGLHAEMQAVRTPTAKVDISIALSEYFDADGRPAGLTGSLDYALDLFDRETAEALAAGLVRVLEAVTAAPGVPEVPVSRLDLLGLAEREALLALGDGGPAVAGGLVPDVFAVRAVVDAGLTAVVCGEAAVSYGVLAGRVNRLARWLIAAGVGAGDPVAVLLPRSADSVAVLLAVLAAGAMYVPVDASYPDDRIRFMLADTAPAIVITTAGLARLTGGARVLELDTPRAEGELAALPDGPVQAGERRGPLSGRDPAYMIYTSGSTGRPKGVVVTHQGLANLAAFEQREVMAPAAAAGRRLRAGLAGTLSFDGSWNMVLWLLAGHELHVLDDDVRRDAHALVGYAREHAIDVIEVTPTYAGLLIEEGLLDGVNRPRVLALGGEAVSAGLWEQVAQAEGVTGWNFYGPTECTVDCAVARVTGPRPVIGRPVAGTRAYLLDEWLRPVPAGVPGALYVAGAQVAAGYRGRPELTAQRFVPDPFQGGGGRMYRTGDLARWTRDGQLEFLGRTDDQVKVRGFRIEPAEIAAVLAASPLVAQAAVIVRDSNLIAYLTPATTPDGTVPDEPLDPGELRRYALGRLPAYMVPGAFVTLDVLPLSPNGKLDQAALPDPEHTAQGRGPRNQREEALCRMYAELLGREPIGIDDNFFALGGHSLLATRLTSRVRTELGAELSVRAVFQAPTVADLSAELASAGAARPALRPMSGAGETTFPLSFAQRRLWFLSRLEGPGVTYNMAGALWLRGPLDCGALGAAVNDVIERHEPLRTVFPDVDGEPCQQILPMARARLELGVLEPGPGEFGVALERAANHVFDLAEAVPPFWAQLLAAGTDEHVLMIVAHHIAGDGWSTGRLLRDVGRAYQARSRGRVPDWEPLPVRYVDYTLWQTELLGQADDPGSVLAGQLAFWAKELAGAPACLPLPADRPRPPFASYRGDAVPLALSRGLHARLAGLARENEATLFMVLHAGLAVLLSRRGAGTDITVGSPLAGRTDEALDDLVGFFINTVVVRTDLSADPAFRSLLAQVRERVLAVLENQDVPFELVVEHLNPERSPSRNPLFQVMLTLQNMPRDADLVPGLHAEMQAVRTPTAKVDISIALSEYFDADGRPAGLTGSLDYALDLFDRETAEALAAGLVRVLEAVTAAPGVPEVPVSRLDLLGLAEREALLALGDGGPAVAGGLVPDVFAVRAVVDAGLTAVVCGEAAVSYGVLAGRVNRLARWLIAAGVGAGDPVAVLLPRSADSVAVLLAVLAAGAMYVPVDASYPDDRIRFMLADTAPAIVITTAGLARLTGGARVLELDTPRAEGELAALPDGPVQAGERRGPLSGRDPAYMIYTSGSTGRPKGVVVTHQGLANLAAFEQREVMAPAAAAGRRLRAGLAGTLSFDGSWNMVLWLLAGHELHVLDDDVRRDAHALVGYAREHAIDVIEVTPTYAGLLIEEGLLDGVNRPRVLALGGEAVSAGLWEQVAQAEGVTGWNFYGPTECTVDCAVARVTGPRPVIGRPVAGTRAYLLDEWLRPVPAGVPGALYVAGAQVAAGYRGRPELTAQRFVPDPFQGGGGRMYRTGDLARWTRDGQLEFLGRTDDQVKVRGFRIEPAEIAAVLAASPLVAQAAVIVRDSNLIAYLTPAGPVPNGTEDLDELRRYATSRLPAYMVPAAFVTLDALPLSPNGKLDQAALPAPELTAPGRAARTAREEALCCLFAEILGLETVGADDNFFALGGHSLLATRLVRRIRAALGADLPVRLFLQAPTVAGVIESLTADPAVRARVDPVLPIRTSGGQPPLFCVHPVSGVAWCYSGLQRHLPADLPIYGLQLDTEVPAADTLAEVTASYADRIRSVQPAGPYRLLGWSLGGSIAHAVAARLQQEGEQVELLALLDSYPAKQGLLDLEPAALLDAIELAILATMAQDLGLGTEVADDPRSRQRLRQAVAQGFGLPESTLADLARGAASLIRLVEGGVPDGEHQTFHGDILYVQAQGSRERAPDVAELWQPYVSGTIDHHAIDCGHFEMMKPDPMAAIGSLLAARIGA